MILIPRSSTLTIKGLPKIPRYLNTVGVETPKLSAILAPLNSSPGCEIASPKPSHRIPWNIISISLDFTQYKSNHGFSPLKTIFVILFRELSETLPLSIDHLKALPVSQVG